MFSWAPILLENAALPVLPKTYSQIAKNILKQEDDVEFAARTSLEEEDADMPKRGVDNFGFIFKECAGEFVLEKIVAFDKNG